MSTFNAGEYIFVSMFTHKHAPLLKRAEVKKLVIGRLSEAKKHFRLNVAAYVILHNQVQLLFGTARNYDPDEVLQYFQKRAQQDVSVDLALSKDAPLWSTDLCVRVVKDKKELRDHLDFIHYAPVSAGLVDRPAEYRWSSLPARVEEGYYPDNWAELAPPASVAKVLVQLAEPALG